LNRGLVDFLHGPRRHAGKQISQHETAQLGDVTHRARPIIFASATSRVALRTMRRRCPGSVRHIPELRRLMLRDLLAQRAAGTVKEIDEAAVKYYSGQPGPRARAEEIYHRLRLGETGTSLDARWIEGAGEYLRSAVEELPPPPGCG